MKATKFQTNVRLWMLIALVLFAVIWLTPLLGDIHGEALPVVVWRWFVALVHGEVPSREFFGITAFFVLFTCVVAIVAVVIGWLLHCAVVIVRTRRRESKDHAVGMPS
jgi:hypothetical protein